MSKSDKGEDRREFLQKMGVVGATLGSVSIAGCSGSESSNSNTENVNNADDSGSEAGNQESGDVVSREIQHVSNTEKYNPPRYQSNVLVDENLSEVLGINVKTNAMQMSGPFEQHEESSNFDLITYNWYSENGGDPDNVIYDRFHTDGARNYENFSNEDYDKLAEKQRKETDQEKRKEMVMEAQKMIGELRPESQYLYNEYIYAYNNNRINPDSVVADGRLGASVWSWVEMEPTNEEGQEIVTNNWDPMSNLNPFHHNTIGPARNWGPTQLLHDFLVRVSPNYEPEMWAADDVSWSGDASVTVTLRDGMTFHDGEDVTAEDVAWTFQTILDTKPAAFEASVNSVVESVEQTGDRKVTFTLQDRYVPFETLTLSQVPILPKHVWTGYISESGNKDSPWKVSIGDDRPIIGSGPFQYGTWQKGSRFDMPAFDDHYRAPKISKRVQRPLDTRSAELRAIRQGEYDWLDYWFGDAANLADAVEQNDHLSSFTSIDNTRQATWVNCENPPFDDVAFRQAVNAVIESLQPVIIEEINNGYGKRAHSPITELVAFWHNPDTPYFEGKEKARQILQDAGYTWDDDGNLHYPAN